MKRENSTERNEGRSIERERGEESPHLMRTKRWQSWADERKKKMEGLDHGRVMGVMEVVGSKIEARGKS